MRRKRGRVIAVCAAKPGTGKSIVAASLAATIGRRRGLRVGIVDLSLQFGDQGLLHGLGPTPSLVDALDASRRTDDPGELLDCMTQVGRVDVLPGPPSPELGRKIALAEVGVVMEKLRTLFDVIVLDTDSYLDSITTWVLETADRLVVLTTPHPTSLRSTTLLLRTMGHLEIGPRRITLVLNRAEPGIRMTVHRAERLVRYPFSCQLSHAAVAIQDSVMRARPMAVTAPSHVWSCELEQLALEILDPKAAARERRRRRPLWRRQGSRLVTSPVS